YHEEAEQIWLQPRADGLVRFAVGTGVTASSGSAYVDTANNIVKLVSDVRLEDRRRGSGAPALSMRCEHWAELLLAEPESDEAVRESAAADNVVNLTALREATFVGAVAIRMAEQRLTAERVSMHFKPGPSDAPIESLFDRATARGNVVLIARPTNGWGRLSWVPQSAALLRDATLRSFGLGGRGQLGARQSLACDWLEAQFERDESGEVYPRVVDATGAIELRDRRSNVAARGRHLNASFGPGGHLEHATVTGQGSRPAWVYAQPFAVIGEQIELDPRTQSLDVPGQSRLSFLSSASLQGRQHGRTRLTHVNSQESMHVSGPDNIAHFRGLVVATSGDERLRCDEMELRLADVEPPADKPRQASWDTLLGQTREQTPEEPASQPRRLFSTDVDDGGFARKTAVQLVAQNAVIESESFMPGDPRPLVQSSIRAPTLNVDIPKRLVETTGGTTLLMTSRQLENRTPVETASFGVPSGLMTRGPHQTAIKCDGAMTYQIGSDGPDRRDGVVFDQGVVMKHVAGKEMVNLDEMFTPAERQSEAFVNLSSRRSELWGDRLECTFGASGAQSQLVRRRQTAGPPMQLSQLLATGNVYMGDRQGDGIREVNADQVDYNQATGLVIVRGKATQPARVYYSNPQTGRFAAPAVGTEIILDLHNNTIRVPGRLQGEIVVPEKADRP
ncbi:MAG: hypothetical protein JXO22_08530, partial [Phycisphaerae bacterium]|nr:hypothetical protein [Phycisphaerae bacterium]